MQTPWPLQVPKEHSVLLAEVGASLQATVLGAPPRLALGAQGAPDLFRKADGQTVLIGPVKGEPRVQWMDRSGL